MQLSERSGVDWDRLDHWRLDRLTNCGRLFCRMEAWGDGWSGPMFYRPSLLHQPVYVT